MNERIRFFWKEKKHVALFGFSRNPKSVSRQVYDLLVKKGYSIYPINPNADKIDSITSYRSLENIKSKIDAAVIITNPKISADIVKQCQVKGINELWFQLDTMDSKLKKYCDDNGINYINSCVLVHDDKL